MNHRHVAVLCLALCILPGATCSAQLTILNMHDTDAIAPGGTSPFTANYVRDAAAAIGASLTVVTSGPAFDTAFDTMGPWDVVIYSTWTNARVTTPTLDRLVQQANAGRKAIINGWNIFIDGLQSHTFFSTTVPCTITGDYTSALDMYAWTPTHPLWTTPQMVAPLPMTGTTHPSWNRDGQFAQPAGGSVAPGGYGGPAPSSNNAGIILNPEGTAIFNTFTPQQYPMAAMVDLYINEIMYNASMTSCAISSPSMGAMTSGNVDIVFDASDTEGDPITSTFEYSTDGGTTWLPATPAATSPLSNPDLGRPSPLVAAQFTWDSYGDGVGTSLVVITQFRVTVTDGGHFGNCDAFFLVDNLVPPPMCMVTVPVGTARNDVDVDVTSSTSSTATITLEWSSDGGVTYSPCTMSPASAVSNPATGVPVGVTTFTWDSRADGVGLTGVASAILRAMADDGVSTTVASCMAVLQVDNSQLCGGICGDCNLNGVGPDVVDALSAAQVAVSLIVPTASQTACCDVNTSGQVDVVDALFIAQAAAGIALILVCA